MRRILVPLDGSDLATTILDDAIRLAGPDGTLILTYEVKRPVGRGASVYVPEIDTEPAKMYLEGVAEGLRARGVSVVTVARSTFHVSAAIDDVARLNNADMIACATHSRGALGSLLWGSVAWKVLSQSPVPMLLRHPSPYGSRPVTAPDRRRILVPLDGSVLAEQALPLAQQLAGDWRAPIDLLLSIPESAGDVNPVAAEEYLERMASGMSGEVRRHVLEGDPVVATAAFARGAGVTDIVMTSHGRTGLSRVFLGSVAHDLIRAVPLPVIVIPALVAEAILQRDETKADTPTSVTA